MNAGKFNKEIYYVDKSLIVKTFLKIRHRVQLISAPQGFLKTSNLRLLASFFDITNDPKVEMKRRRVFENTKIMEQRFIVEDYFGKFPTIFITFEHDETYDVRKMREIIWVLFRHYDFLLQSNRLTRDEKRQFRAYLDYPAAVSGSHQRKLADAVSVLCELLYKHYQKPVYVFVDNYDSPILDALSNNRPMYNFLPFLERMLESIAASKGLNRLLLSGTTSISTLTTMKITEFKFLTNKKYAKYFGFTEEDLQELAVRCSTEVMEVLKKGCYYTTFNAQIYSPEWVLNHLNHSPIENPYWYENILKKQIYDLPVLKTKIRLLVQGEYIKFGTNRYKSKKDIWMTNQLMNGTQPEELEESEINLLFLVFLEFGLLSFTRRHKRISWQCVDSDPRPKLTLQNTSRGSKILRTKVATY